MTVYSVKGKGWRYDFTLNKQRYTGRFYKTRKEALTAEAQKKEEIRNPVPVQKTPTDMAFLDLVNLRLDHVQAYNSDSHYKEYVYQARRWVKLWGKLQCNEITPLMVEKFVLQRGKTSPYAANKDIRYLRATFNFGIKRKFITVNPALEVDFLPVEKRVKYVPPPEDLEKVIAIADPETRDYLICIRETMARKGEIDRLTWDDINFERRELFLYTRKKRGGHLTPRRIPMTSLLYEVLHKRYEDRDPTKPWVFWHRYWSQKEKRFIEGPYKDRKKIMKSLCAKAGVKYFRFHAIRHSGASLLEQSNVPISSIQRILGHENRTTTEIYLHSIGDSERQAMMIFEHAREKSHIDSHIHKKST